MTSFNIAAFGASSALSDNTDAIQGALDAAMPGDIVVVPQGEFSVDAVRHLLVRSGTTLQIDGIIRALPNASANYVVVLLMSVHDVTITGRGKIAGDRNEHKGTPEQGMAGFCLEVLNSSNVKINGWLGLTDAWGDGLYIQDSRNIEVSNIICYNNSRNGMSIIGAVGLSVTGCTFELTGSVAPYPQAGIDIEPDRPDQALIDIWIANNRFARNKGPGCYIAFEEAANRTRVHVINNVFDQHYHDGSGPPIGGRNTWLANLLYSTLRWMPGYDYWAFPRSFTLS